MSATSRSWALADFLLQRQFTQPGEPARVGWVVLAGESLRRGKEVVLTLDLGFGALPIATRRALAAT